MPILIHTRVGTVREVTGTVFRLGPDGTEQPLKAGDRVLAGDAIVTRQDGFVEIVEDAVQPPLAAGSAEVDRVIAAIEAGDPAAAPGAGLVGGAGSSLSDGFRVGRISEDLGASAALPSIEFMPSSALTGIDSATANNGGRFDGNAPSPPIDITAPLPTITLDLIAGNDVLNVAEAGDPALRLSGRVGGDARPGDTVMLSVGGQEFVTTVLADGSFAVLVPGSLLAGGAAAGVTAVVTSVDDAGNIGGAGATRPYTLNLAPTAVDDAAALSEDGPAASGDLTPGTAGQDSDPEGDFFSVSGVAAAGSPLVGRVGSAVAGRWGSLLVSADGSYVYTPGSAAQSLGQGDSATDIFSYQVTDSEGNTTTATLMVSLNGKNDAALITGSLTGQVVEDGQLVATGRLLVNDADSGESAVRPQSGLVGLYGVFSIGSDGVWTYRLDNPSPDVQALAAGQTVTESFTVTTSDGSMSVVVVSVLGTDDAAVVSLGAGTVVEDDRPTATGTLVASDTDNPAPVFLAAVQAGAWGELTLQASGAWTYTLGDAAQTLAAGEVVTERFTVNLSDGSITKVTITVTGTDDLPVITDGIGAVIEDTRPTASGTLTASDVDNPALAFMAGVQPGAYGELTLQAGGQWSYTLGDAAQALAEGEVKTEAFTVLLSDGLSTMVTITVRGTDDMPLISAGNGSVVEDVQPVASGTLTASDIDSPAPAFVPGTQTGFYGELTLTATGVWRYTLGAAAQALAAGEVAIEQFTVTLDDGSTTTVTIDITGTDDLPVISVGTGSVIEDTLPTAAGTLTASDIDNPSLAFLAGAQTDAYGTLTLQASGAWSYALGAAAQTLAAGEEATERFTVRLNDGSTTTVTIDITGTDDRPAISAGRGTVIEDDQPTAMGTLTARDIDNPALAFVANSQTGAYGTLTLQASGAWSYTLGLPAQALTDGQRAGELFTVTLTDGSTTTVTIDITGTDDLPVISADTGSVIEDRLPTATGTLTASDIDNPTLAFVAGSQAGTFGELTLQASGAWGYTLGAAAQTLAAGETAVDRITVTLTDGSTTTVTIDITGTDDLPVISGGTGSVIEDAQPTAIGTLTASDVDNPGLAFVAEAQTGAYGELTLQTGGAWSYTLGAVAQALAEGQKVGELFTVTLTDGSTTTVTIQITGSNDAPLAVADITTAREAGGVANGTPGLNPGGNVLGNDTDIDIGDTRRVSAVVGIAAGIVDGATAGQFGTLALAAGGQYVYTVNNSLAAVHALRDAGDTLTDTFSYTVTDANGLSSTSTLTVTITGANDAPTAVNDGPLPIDEDTPLAGIVVLGNDGDVEGDRLAVTAASSAQGNVTVNADNTLSFAPAANFNGPATISYTISDGRGGSASATVTVNVRPVVDLTAGNDSFTLAEDTFLFGSVAGNDSTTSGGVLTYTVARNAANGGVIFNADGSFRYTPRGNFNGADSFEYTVADAASGESLRRTVNLGVTLVNDAPVVAGGGAATLTAVNEDTTNPPGATVSALFSANFSNLADAGNLTQNQFAGVAVVADGSSALAGRWQYSTNAGASWLDLGAVSDAAARLLGTSDRLRFLPAADFNGSVPVLNVRLIDNSLPFSSGGLSDVTLRGGSTPVSSGTVALSTRINPVNDAPLAPSAEITATEEGADVGPAITAPFDIDSPTITIRVTALPTIGDFYLKVGNVLTLVNVGDSLTAAEAASLYYRPPQDYVPGSDVGKLVYQVGDGQFNVTGEVRVNVLPVDDAPRARAGAAAGSEDGAIGNAGNPPVTLTLTGSDVDSPITAITVTALPAHGLLYLADGVTRVQAGIALTPAQAAGLLFVPDAHFNGPTTLQFTVRSPDLTTADPNDTRDSAPATFTLNIRAVNDAPTVADVTVSAAEEGQPVALGIAAPGDIDDPAGALLITVTDLPDTGAVLLNANDPASVVVVGQRLSLAQLQGLFYQPPADYDGLQAAGSLVYEVTDNKLITTGSATIDLRPINDSPIASEVNRKVVDPSQPLDFQLGGSDRDGNVVAFIITSLPAAADGRLVLADGSAITAGQQIPGAGTLAVRFEPAAGFTGTASFSYQVLDNGVDSPGGQAAPLTSAPVLVSLDYSGGGAPDITVTVTGAEDSDIPFAAADVGVPGGLITLTDLPDHGSLAYPDGTPVPVGAVLTPAELETLVYTPDPDYNGSDGAGFSYQPPGGGAPQSGEITIVVTPTPDLPVAVNDTVAPTVARQPVEDRPFNIDVPANDFDPDAGETALLRVTAINGQAIVPGGTVAVFSPGGVRWGAVTLLADGTLQFTPAADVNGPVSFDYTVTDPTGLNNAPDGGGRNGTVSLNLAAVNDAPQALLPDIVSTNEETPVTFNPAANDTDVDGDALRVTDVEQAAHGQVVLNADGSVTYTPDKDYFGPDSYSYTVADGKGGVSTGTVAVTVRPVNDPPVAASVTLMTNEDAPLSGRLPMATDVEGDPIAYSAALAPAHGTLVVNADGSYVYTPAADYFGGDSFSYTVSDAGGSNSYAVAVTVKPVNDAPVIVNRTLTVNEEAAAVSLGAGASDVDVRDRLTITVTGLPGTGLGTVLLNGAAVTVGQQLTSAQLALLTYTAPVDYDGLTPAGAFTYRVSDGLLNTSGSIVIDLQPVNDAPVNKVPPTTLVVAEDGSLAFTGSNRLSVSDVDAGSGAITVTLSAADGGLTLNDAAGVTIGGNGSGLVTMDGTLAAVNNALASLTFRPAPNFNGATAVTMLSNDHGNTGPGEKTDQDLINISVTSVNDAPSGSNASVILTADGSHVLARTDFGFADSADSPPNAFTSVLVNPTAAGALRLDGNLVAAGTLVTVAQLDAGRLVFTPDAGASGPAYASFGFQVRDNGGTANAGVDTDPTANTISFDVLPVIVPPGGAPASVLAPQSAMPTQHSAMLAEVYAWSLEEGRLAAPASGHAAAHASGRMMSQPLELHDLLGGDESFSLEHLLGGGSGHSKAVARGPDAGAALAGGAADTRLLIEGVDIHAVLGMPGSAFEHPLMHSQIERSKLLADTA